MKQSKTKKPRDAGRGCCCFSYFVIMAWDNIDDRRAQVRQMFDLGYSKFIIKRVCSSDFNCSRSAVMADIHVITGNVAHVNPSQKNRIKQRDNYTCQYCGIYKPYSGIIEHVVPFAIGGHAKDYNLVFACQRCNTEKRTSVWIPDNLDLITKDNPTWREKIITMARKEAVKELIKKSVTS